MARKISLFFGNERAARKLVVLYSLVATCVKHGINPELYIRDVLIRIQDWPLSRLAELLPHRWRERFGPDATPDEIVRHDAA
jgi:transposase